MTDDHDPRLRHLQLQASTMRHYLYRLRSTLLEADEVIEAVLKLPGFEAAKALPELRARIADLAEKSRRAARR
jgi:hypothetical protein